MNVHLRCRAALSALIAALATAAPGAMQAVPPVSLDRIVRAAGDYVEQYERALSAIVAQEDYRQVVIGSQLSGSTARTLRSDLLVLDAGQAGWVSFRDVYEVDDRPVRDHDQRLADLLAHFSPESLPEARRIAAEGARFNLNAKNLAIDRNLNTPMTALLFLRASAQARSAFEVGKFEDVEGLRTVALRFTEQTKPRLIATKDDAAASGVFWIEPTTGRVVRSDLELQSGGAREPFVIMRIEVKYARVPNLDVWVPVTMDEAYEMPQSLQGIRGHADYSHFRQFGVTVDESVR